MKITNSDIIKSGERELIDSIIGDLDWDAIEEIVKNRHKLKIQDDVEYRQGDIIVHNEKVAYKLDFDVKMTLSVVFDRDGNYLSLITSDTDDEEPAEETPVELSESEGASGIETTENARAPEEEPNSDEFSNGGEDAPTPLAEAQTVANESGAPQTEDPAGQDLSDAFMSSDAPTANPEDVPKENFSKMASHIAEMISDINDD